MNDLIIFTNGPRAYAPKRIVEESQKLGVEAGIMQYRDIRLDFLDDTLPSAKGVFIRGMGEDVNHLPLKYFIIDYYKDRAKVINADSFKTWMSLDKITQHVEYAKNAIPVAKSYYFGSRDLALENLKTLTFPLIAKFNAGSKGKSVYKLESVSDLEKILNEKHDIRTILFQDFLLGGEDLRVIVLDGKVLGAMKRIAKEGSYLANFSQGGSVEKYDIEKDTEASSIALKVAKTFKLDYCGVDLMKNTDGRWVVIEVNRACQFQGFEKATGVNVAEKIVDFLIK